MKRNEHKHTHTHTNAKQKDTHQNEWSHIVRPDIIRLEGVNPMCNRDGFCVCSFDAEPATQRASERGREKAILIESILNYT